MKESIFSPLECEPRENLDDRKSKKNEDIIPVSFYIENKWDGIVLGIEGENVFSRMTDVQSGEEYEFDFKIEDVEDDDKQLIQQGALFNFYIGYVLSGKTRSNSRMIKFRRQRMSHHMLDSILDKMNDLNIADIIKIQ